VHSYGTAVHAHVRTQCFSYEPRWVWRAANELLSNSPEHEALRQELYPPQSVF
jgi:hypothetical protein